MRPLVPYLDNPAVTELRVRPGQVVTDAFKEKGYEDAPELSLPYLRSLATAMIAYAGLSVRSVNYVTLPGSERGTILMPPVVLEGTLTIVIRKHSAVVKSAHQLDEEGAFADCRDVSFNQPTEAEAKAEAERTDFRRLEPFELELLDLKRQGRIRDFLLRCVALKRNIVVSGKAGSGKTTLTRSLIEAVPTDEHIATIEDVHELFLPNHKEVTNLFYGDGSGRIFALACLAACMRITPERIFLAELRGGEALEYTNALNTDHGGGITTTHANGAIEAFDSIATLIKNSDVGRTLEMESIKHVLYTTVDVVLYMRARKVLQVFYDPIFKRRQMS
ncbi:Type II/IV secretion system ATP hydrolase TadA/VirB11/CpaF, TadA subfamily [Candidatus Burkholderia verschuerenii]|uniref:Type II/IV secretion system ATP hydrolase TadA/VirB11/CpaF, TadA subfamily n=2 Tax=Candidatus Burkholderia verschuerenii TaxID=242163 RepID=A0A0L0MD21_9BURK|nr:Type II/IV secretion system ATP hydrolase TadA/VirB11/CpaF, TadA subfamily [Candidatus Burkholderia verschuerenii]